METVEIQQRSGIDGRPVSSPMGISVRFREQKILRDFEHNAAGMAKPGTSLIRFRVLHDIIPTASRVGVGGARGWRKDKPRFMDIF